MKCEAKSVFGDALSIRITCKDSISKVVISDATTDMDLSVLCTAASLNMEAGSFPVLKLDIPVDRVDVDIPEGIVLVECEEERA